MSRSVLVTGLGMITPLGRDPPRVLDRMLNQATIAVKPPFSTSRFDCPVCAPVDDFQAEDYFPDNKSLRLMNRDAQLAVAAARLALLDAGVTADETYASEDIALYGATGVAGIPLEEIVPIIQMAAREDGTLDLQRYGRVALKRVRPVLSFKILANMPICFVSIFLNIRGPNTVYTPWEGHGAQAIAAGIRSIRRGDVPCALVGGCDVKVRELSFIHLQQSGVFASWRRFGTGSTPGEGAVFLVLEEAASARRRGKKPYAELTDYRFGSASSGTELGATFCQVLSSLAHHNDIGTVVASGDGDVTLFRQEQRALADSRLNPGLSVRPKSALGNLFAAAAAAQVATASLLASQSANGYPILANCFGHGSEQAAFVVRTA